MCCMETREFVRNLGAEELRKPFGKADVSLW